MIATRARSGRIAGFTLGLAAGILYGLVGGVLKAAVHAVIHQPVAAVAAWPTWALVVLGVLGGWAVVVHQRAYAHAPLSVSLPGLSVANPLAAMLFGAAVFGRDPPPARWRCSPRRWAWRSSSRRSRCWPARPGTESHRHPAGGRW